MVVLPLQYIYYESKIYMYPRYYIIKECTERDFTVNCTEGDQHYALHTFTLVYSVHLRAVLDTVVEITAWGQTIFYHNTLPWTVIITTLFFRKHVSALGSSSVILIQLYYAHQPLIKTCTTTFAQYFKSLYTSFDIMLFCLRFNTSHPIFGLSSVKSHKSMLLASLCLSSCNNSWITPQILMKFDVGEFTKM
jgi:hypothetical protein